jgi:post-segregation antitoxin (ccd killing protein)
MRLLNVRLDPADEAKVRALRARGANLSRLVREAIRVEYQRRAGVPRPEDVEAILEAIHAAHPVPRDEPKPLRLHDRHRFRRAVARHLRRRARP